MAPSAMARIFLGLVVLCASAGVAAAPRARLVHCGADTCLRVTGRRAGPAVAVRIAGRTVPVQGGDAWRVTLPLSVARDGVDATGEVLTLTLADRRTGSEEVQSAILPPGALGGRVELASLVVRAR